MTRHVLIVSVLVLVDLFCAVAVVNVKHVSRDLQHDLQVLRSQNDKLKIAWAQLRLEESTLANYNHVRRIARTELGMHVPKHYVVLGEDHE